MTNGCYCRLYNDLSLNHSDDLKANTQSNPRSPRRLQHLLMNNIMSLPKATPELILAHSPSGDIVLDGLNSTFRLKKDLPLPYCGIARFSYSPFISPTIRPNVP
jgi:hypothetical protein